MSNASPLKHGVKVKVKVKVFESGVKVPIMALGLRGGAVKPFGNLSLVLLSMGGLVFVKQGVK